MTDALRTRAEHLQRLGNLVANLAHPKGDHRENALEDEAHDIIRELRDALLRDGGASPEPICVACQGGHHTQCLGGRCECIHQVDGGASPAEGLDAACLNGHVWTHQFCSFEGEWNWPCDCGELSRDWPSPDAETWLQQDHTPPGEGRASVPVPDFAGLPEHHQHFAGLPDHHQPTAGGSPLPDAEREALAARLEEHAHGLVNGGTNASYGTICKRRLVASREKRETWLDH